MKKEFKYFPDEGVSVCYIYNGDLVFKGEACCCFEDRDFCSEITGCTIAGMRADIKYLKWVKENEIKSPLKAFKHLASCITSSNKFNKNHYESKMLYKTIKKYEDDLKNINAEIKNIKEDLKFYIDEKDKLYQRLRNKVKAN